MHLLIQILPAGLPAFLACAGLMVAAAAAQPGDAPRLASKAEYKACRLAERQLQARLQALEKAGGRLNETMARHQADANAYLEAQQKKGLRRPADVAAYNDSVARLNAITRELSGRQATLRAEQQGYNAEVLRLNVQCGGQMVAQDVADEVERELKAAASD